MTAKTTATTLKWTRTGAGNDIVYLADGSNYAVSRSIGRRWQAWYRGACLGTFFATMRTAKLACQTHANGEMRVTGKTESELIDFIENLAAELGLTINVETQRLTTVRRDGILVGTITSADGAGKDMTWPSLCTYGVSGMEGYSLTEGTYQQSCARVLVAYQTYKNFKK